MQPSSQNAHRKADKREGRGNPKPVFVPHSFLLIKLTGREGRTGDMKGERGKDGRDQRGRLGKGQVCLIDIKRVQLSSDS